MAIRITDYWEKSNIIASEKKDVYVYGLDIILSTIWITFIVALISLAFGDILYLIFYFLCFFPLRGYCGGFHAKTHWGCALMQCVSFTGVVLASVALGAYLPFLPLVLFTVMFLPTMKFAPAEHPENPINPDKKKTLRRNGLITLVLIVLAIGVLGNH